MEGVVVRNRFIQDTTVKNLFHNYRKQSELRRRLLCLARSYHVQVIMARAYSNDQKALRIVGKIISTLQHDYPSIHPITMRKYEEVVTCARHHIIR